MRLYLKLLILMLVVATLHQFINASPNPGKWGKGKGSSGGWSNGGSGYKSKSKFGTLKKAAVIGLGAYAGYQVGKLAGNFASMAFNPGYSFDDWNNWREADGFLCRNNQDCNWIDQRMYCQDYEFNFSPTNAWFGGDVASIVGECSCPNGMIWNNNQLTCQNHQLTAIAGSIIAVIVISCIIGCCCCAGLCYMARKMIS